MSVSSLLDQETKDENWSDIYCKNLSIGDRLTTNVLKAENTISFNPLVATGYSLPTSQGLPGFTLSKLIPFGITQFSRYVQITAAFGAVTNANPRYLLAGGNADVNPSSTLDFRNNFRVPFPCTLSRLSMTSLNGSTSTQWNILKNNVLVGLITFDQFGIYDTAFTPTLKYGLGDTMAIGWLGVGTQPNNTLIIATFSQDF